MSVFVGIRDGPGLIYQNWNKGIFTCQPAFKSILGRFRGFTCQWDVKEVFFVNVLQNFLICAKAAKEPK